MRKKSGLGAMSKSNARRIQILGGKASPTNFANMPKKKLRAISRKRWLNKKGVDKLAMRTIKKVV